MKTFFNLQDLTGQIQSYVRRIKERQSQASIQNTSFDIETIFVPRQQEIRSNINKLNGENKFSIQTMVNDEKSLITSSDYVEEAYNHLSHLEDKNKIVIDFMHKNNRNYDLDV